jgi:hypothetical protein
MRTSFFTICDFQDELGQQLKEITYRAVGNHVKRSRGAAMRKGIVQLEKRGYSHREAVRIVSDALDMAKLEMAAEDQ